MRRTQLLEAGAHLIARDGFANVTVEQIAGEIGLVKAGFYYHFDTKLDLLTAIVVETHEAGLQILDHLFEEGGTAQTRVESYIREHARWIVEHSDRVEIIRREAAVLPKAQGSAVTTFRRRFSEGLSDQIRIGQGEGEFDPSLNPRLAAHTILGMLNWLAQWRRVEPSLSEDDMVTQVARQALGGLSPSTFEPTHEEASNGQV
ncbi:MAG: TetR/AcrR family transcriptional regulator [bacterium]|nr:TetR/AcrR family transcriptional regulator [bacterium]